MADSIEQANAGNIDIQMKNSIFILLILALLSVIVFVQKDVENRKDDLNKFLSIPMGTTVLPFELLDENEHGFDTSVFRVDKPLAMFFFSEKCPTCDSNIFFWEKLKKVLGNRMEFMGVILSGTDGLTKFNNLKDINFKVYRPENVKRLKDQFKIRFPASRTVIIQNNAVIFSKTGELTPEEFFKIKNTISGG